MTILHDHVWLSNAGNMPTANGRDQEAVEVMSRFEEDGMAWMAHSRALVAFRREGDSEKSRKLVRAAVKHNRHLSVVRLNDASHLTPLFGEVVHRRV
jgi:hypothetical protein